MSFSIFWNKVYNGVSFHHPKREAQHFFQDGWSAQNQGCTLCTHTPYSESWRCRYFPNEKGQKLLFSKGKVGYPWESTRDIYQHIPPIYGLYTVMVVAIWDNIWGTTSGNS